MQDIAILTAANLFSDAPDRRSDAHQFDLELQVLAAGFARHGLSALPVRWTEGKGWGRYAAVLALGVWDYQDRHNDFLAVLDAIAAAGVPVFNAPDTVRWNIRKTYLRELEARGVAVIPTHWPEVPQAADIEAAMAAFGCDDVVLKRQVGAGARGQIRYSRGAMPTSGPLLDRPGMIQPFMGSIATEGEYSFLFVDGAFSHALVKRPRSGEYRIQDAYGGTSHAIDPAADDLRAAASVLAAAPAMPLYARVDMVRGARGDLLLMELEVIEPYLFPQHGPQIGTMLGAALAERIS